MESDANRLLSVGVQARFRTTALISKYQSFNFRQLINETTKKIEIENNWIPVRRHRFSFILIDEAQIIISTASRMPSLVYRHNFILDYALF